MQIPPSKSEEIMGCLFALVAAAFPRLAFLIYWLARPALVDAAFDTFIFPLLGILFLPFATLMYVLLYTPGVGLSSWDWFWVAFAGLLDLGHWAAAISRGGSRMPRPGRV
jgi:hypothetical protein